MSGLPLALRQACAKFGLAIEFDHAISLNTHLNVTVPDCIVYLGGTNGMLVFTDMATAWSNRMTIRAAGYGYTVLEDRPIDRALDMDSFRDMFRDWGWSGPAELKPSWLYPSGPVNQFCALQRFADRPRILQVRDPTIQKTKNSAGDLLVQAVELPHGRAIEFNPPGAVQRDASPPDRPNVPGWPDVRRMFLSAPSYRLALTLADAPPFLVMVGPDPTISRKSSGIAAERATFAKFG